MAAGPKRHLRGHALTRQGTTIPVSPLFPPPLLPSVLPPSISVFLGPSVHDMTRTRYCLLKAKFHYAV